MALFGAAIGAIAGGIAGAITAGKQAQANYKAKRKYAQQLRDATEKYKGQNEYNLMQQGGQNFGKAYNSMYQGQQLNQGVDQGNNGVPLAGINSLSSGFQQGNSQGQAMAKTLNDANFQRDTQEAQNALNMDLTQNAVDRQSAQAAMNGASGLASLYGQLKGSDEEMKEPINNDSGLPASDIEDSMRQIETVKYQYKDPEEDGADGEVHESGVTAQSLEKTPLFEGSVVEDNGKKKVDMWKLEEALTAGIAQLQREVDELERKDDRDNESDA